MDGSHHVGKVGKPWPTGPCRRPFCRHRCEFRLREPNGHAVGRGVLLGVLKNAVGGREVVAAFQGIAAVLVGLEARMVVQDVRDGPDASVRTQTSATCTRALPGWPVTSLVVVHARSAGELVLLCVGEPADDVALAAEGAFVVLEGLCVRQLDHAC
eukprot:16392791-Heterocapsa_arctica.AAC.1